MSLIRLKKSLRQAFFLSLILFGIMFIAYAARADDGVRLFVETGDSLVVMDSMTIPEAKTYGHVVVLKGDLEFNGKAKTLTVVNGKVHLGSKAEIFEKMVLVNGTITQEPGAKAPMITGGGDIKSWATDEWGGAWSETKAKLKSWKDKLENGGLLGILALPFAALILIAALIVLAGVGVVLFFLAPSLSYRADRVLRLSPFISILWGMAGYIAVIPLMILMIFSIIGILVVPFYVIFVLLVAFAGLFAGCRGLGSWIMRRFGHDNVIVATFIGLFIVFASLWAPFLGHFFFSLIWIAGTGALLRSFFVSDADERFIDVEFRAS